MRWSCWASWCRRCRCCSRSARWSGLGHINGPYALVCATLGAFIGDALSYWIGHRWGAQLRSRWPFSRYPQWLDRGEAMFRRHGIKSIVIARFVGAVRPFVPAIAGMLHMPLRRYALPSLVACIDVVGAVPGAGLGAGASYDAVAAVADRLALVLGALVVAVALVWAVRALHVALVRRPRRQPARARAALDARSIRTWAATRRR